jgi:glucose-specific phosphotransferase system IIA component
MGMNRLIAITSPLNGEVIRLEQVPDQAFAQKRMGEGVAILPSTGQLMSPIDGKVLHLVSTKHAIILEHVSGLQILMHFGLNTVRLQGEGFTTHVASGDLVHTGQLLMDIDLDFIKSSGFSTLTPIVVANEDLSTRVEGFYRTVKAGDPTIMNVFLPEPLNS